ncbi:MAG: hypothetical protein HQK54_14330 [Oligoflexales bacterium]|nr:hypothetical protein [Oligoflexales bacterium]
MFLYSYRNDSMGLSEDALYAGHIPNISPITTEKATAITIPYLKRILLLVSQFIPAYDQCLDIALRPVHAIHACYLNVNSIDICLAGQTLHSRSKGDDYGIILIPPPLDRIPFPEGSLSPEN